MNNKRFSLTQLDEYAKVLTKKQVSMLYENRMHKKYKKVLCESHVINEDEDFSIYLDNNAFDVVDRTDALIELKNLDQSINLRTTPTGVYIYTELPDVYKDIIDWINTNELSDYVDNVEAGYEQYLA